MHLTVHPRKETKHAEVIHECHRVGADVCETAFATFGADRELVAAIPCKTDDANASFVKILNQSQVAAKWACPLESRHYCVRPG